MTSPIDNSFTPTTKADWVAQVNKDLKDSQAYETLRWATPEGFVMEPFYTPDELTNLSLDQIQAAQKQEPGWLNAPFYAVLDPNDSAYREALAAGADALILKLTSKVDLSRLLNGVKLSDKPVFFQIAQPAEAFVRALQVVAPYQWKGGLLNPPDETTAEATRLSLSSPNFRTVCVTAQDFHQAGATATQELAFLLARLADTYDQLTEQGLTIEQLVPKTLISMAVGTSYLPEIAKLRALRVLLARFVAAYSPHSLPFAIHCTTSPFYESTATPYTNLLRATTEAMVAVIGGADVLTVRPYNAVFQQDDAFAQRIARNVSLLLTAESHLDKVADPSAGSFYIEQFTHQLAEAAWALFLQVEELGGLAKAHDFVQTELDRSYEAKVAAVKNGKVLVGVNKFRFDEGEQKETPILTSSSEQFPTRRLPAEFE
jgi:methylmalonyl-CoA mutase